jgi:hypothetical protein
MPPILARIFGMITAAVPLPATTSLFEAVFAWTNAGDMPEIDSTAPPAAVAFKKSRLVVIICSVMKILQVYTKKA